MAAARKNIKKQVSGRTALRTVGKKAPARKTAKRPIKPVAKLRSKPVTRPVVRKAPPSANGKNGKTLVISKNGKTKPVKPLASQKEALQQERLLVENELANLRAELQEAPEMTGDEVDLNVYEREKTLGLVATFERRLEEIDTTLKVAAEGRYGICERCGKTIDPERLKIFPETRLCVSCKNEIEKEQRRLRI